MDTSLERKPLRWHEFNRDNQNENTTDNAMSTRKNAVNKGDNDSNKKVPIHCKNITACGGLELQPVSGTKSFYFKKDRNASMSEGYSTGSLDGGSPTNSLSKRGKDRPRSNSLLNTLRRATRLATLPSILHRSRAEETVSDDHSTAYNNEYEMDAVCLIEDSPNYVTRCAAAGKSAEIERIIKKDATRLHARNNQGQMPLHVAAQKGHLDVLGILLDLKADINALGSNSNTALHFAVLSGHPEVAGFLISHGAKTDILNDSQMAPLHLAADMGNLGVIEEMSKYDLDFNQPGEQGNTPLHYGAAKDNGGAMKLLMAAGSRPCERNSHGFYPIHIAAQCAAASAMETIIENALKAGYSREDILSFKDRENNLPLHAAVNGGNVKAVSVCLKSGASVKVQQDDGSTPVHFASAQGNMEMIELMSSMQKDNFNEAIFITDATRMTPLHRAAFFDHTAVMSYLLDNGADIDSKDIKDRTPLLLAASKGCWAAVQLLISKGADMNGKDKHNRNFLHLAIRFGGKLEQIGGADFIKDIKILQNAKDDFGCTPVHYASREGHLLALDDLIRMGAVLNLKNNAKQSPLHFGARYGRLNTCKRLLNSVHGPNIINETDGDGLTALHIAAQNGHTKVIQLLLTRGAVVNKDHEGSTALHHAASNGWTHSMKILLGVKPNLLDMANVENDTALHVAAKSGQTSAVTLLLAMGANLLTNSEECSFFDYIIQCKNQEVASAVVSHDRWEEVLHLGSTPYRCNFLGLIQHLPEVCMQVLDRCQIASSDDQRNKNYHITFNFSYLERPEGTCNKNDYSKENKISPMQTLLTMVEFNRVNCLSHPVCVTFLKRKWAKYGGVIYTAYLLVYMSFLACLTTFVLSHNSMRHYDGGMNNTTTTHLYGNKYKSYYFSLPYAVCLWFIAAYCTCNIFKEIYQIITQRMRYFLEFQNALEWTLYTSTLIFVLPFLAHISCHWQWESGAVAIFLAWFNCLVFLQRFDFFGIYVVMFLEILRTLIQVVCVFSILIVAFGVSFFMLLSSAPSKAYSTPMLSILRTFTMMLELDYMNSFNELYNDNNDSTLHFGMLTFVLLTVFIFFMPILLMNLLIGLAVGDIESVQRDACLKRLAMQVELHSNMEAKMPLFFFSRVRILQYKEYPNKCKSKLQTVMNMLSGNSGLTDGGDKMNMSDTYLYEEMYKQKVRMREMSSVLDKNYRLLRTIIQKMEIHTEDDAWDEGANDDDTGDDDGGDDQTLYKRVNGKSFKDKMYLKSAVVQMWTKGKKSSS